MEDLQRALDESLRANAALVAKLAEFRHAPSAHPAHSAASTAATTAAPARKFKWASEEASRLSLNPVVHDDVWAFRKRIEGLHWTAQEVDLGSDRLDWTRRMSEGERHFVRMQLAFFARIDIDVLENLEANFGDEVDCMEAKMVYAAQMDQECAHTESYALQIECVMTGEEREHTLNAVRTMPIIRKMREWVLRWFDRALPVGERLVAFAAVEGVLFQASFAALQWLREKNLLMGITLANTYIARDEGVHTAFTCLLVRKYLVDRPSPARVAEIFQSVVKVIDEFVDESLPVRLIGMNAELMRQYVRFQADFVVTNMGYAPIFDVKNPFLFMDKLTLNDVAKTNFFEARATQYQTATKTGAARFALDDTADDD